MKRTNVSVPMWDVVATMPSQFELIQQGLKSIEVSNQSATLDDAISLVHPTKGDK